MKTKTLFVIACLAVTPLFAQTSTTTTTKTTTKKTSASSSVKTRVYNDATRLAGLLHDAQTNITVNSDVWKTVANEANSLANRLYGSTSGNATARKAAKQVRDHVRQFRQSAMNGDAAGARQHASEAMESVNQLMDWAS
jgi:hypothetical protein